MILKYLVGALAGLFLMAACSVAPTPIPSAPITRPMSTRSPVSLAATLTATSPTRAPAPPAERTPTSPVSAGSTAVPRSAGLLGTPVPSRSPSPDTSPTRSTTSTPVARVDLLLARCPTAAEVAGIRRDLTLIFESDPTAGQLACTTAGGSVNLTRLQKRAYNILLVMKQLEFTRPLPWTHRRLYDWFTGTIKSIRFRADVTGGYCCEPQDTINVSVAPNTLILLSDTWIGDGSNSDPVSAAGLRDTLILFVHEARHNEGYGHTCALVQNGTPIPNANDSTVAQLGAWGVQYYALMWLADYGDPALFPTGYRQNSRFHADEIRKTRFCNEK